MEAEEEKKEGGGGGVEGERRGIGGEGRSES